MQRIGGFLFLFVYDMRINLVILDKRDGMCNVHAIRKYGVELRVSFVGYTSTFMPEQCGFHAFF